MIHNKPLTYVLFAMYQEDPKHHKFILLEDATTLREAYREARNWCHAKDQMIMDNYGNQYPVCKNREELPFVRKGRCVTKTEFRTCSGCFFRKLTGGCLH